MQNKPKNFIHLTMTNEILFEESGYSYWFEMAKLSNSNRYLRISIHLFIIMKVTRFSFYQFRKGIFKNSLKFN